MFNKDAFMSFYKGTPNEANASQCYDNISQALLRVGIYTDLTLLGALATVRTEVGRMFLPILEADSGEQYEGREDLGNIVPGDGPKFKGRGYIQLTGHNNYDHFGQRLGIDLVSNPDLALEPIIAANILAYFFKDNRINIECDSKNWMRTRELVNGGDNGLATFLSIVNQYLKVDSNNNQPTTMETLSVLYWFKPVDKTYVIVRSYDSDGKTLDTLSWTSDADLNTNDEVLAFAKAKVDPGIEVNINN